MLAYPLVSKPCSEATDIGDIFSGGSGCFDIMVILISDFDLLKGNLEIWIDIFYIT